MPHQAKAKQKKIRSFIFEVMNFKATQSLKPQKDSRRVSLSSKMVHSISLFLFVCLALGFALSENETSSVQIEYDHFQRCLENEETTCFLLSDQKSSGIYVYELLKNRNDENPTANHAIWSFDFIKSRQVILHSMNHFKASKTF